MKLTDIYRSIVKKGIEEDPRGSKEIERLLKAEKKKQAGATEDERYFFDPDRLFNPYADTRILEGKGGEEIKSIMIGVDIDGSELLLARHLKDNGRKIDLVVSHHPAGRAYANFYEVMSMQPDILQRYGISVAVGEGLLRDRKKEVANKVSAMNHGRTVKMASLLGLPFMCAHTPADNCVSSYLQGVFDTGEYYCLKDIMEELEGIPEYHEAKKNNAGPEIVAGRPESRCGRIMVDMTGGAEGAVKFIEKLAAAGVGTIVGMHFSENHIKEARRNHINLVIAGHISSDSVGLNLLFDPVIKEGGLEIIPVSGFIRIER